MGCDLLIPDHCLSIYFVSIHTEPARIITGATKLCSIGEQYSDLELETLQERRTIHKLVVFFKTLNNLSPNYMSDLVPPLVQTEHYLRS